MNGMTGMDRLTYCGLLGGAFFTVANGIPEAGLVLACTAILLNAICASRPGEGDITEQEGESDG
jgi:hypothetical protein